MITYSIVVYRCDGATVPYLGMYLSDLTFIEESSPNFVDEGLINYSKMRMVSITCTPFSVRLNGTHERFLRGILLANKLIPNPITSVRY